MMKKIGKLPQEVGLSDVSPRFRVPGLTERQLEMRSKGIGASDAEKIMTGNWYPLWEEKTGRAKREDLTRSLPVQMGNVTEAFNAYWYELMTERHVNRAPSVVDVTWQHKKIPWMLCNIDGLVTIDKRIRLFEGKHINPFGSKGDAPARFLAQIQHCLEVLDLEGCELSCFFGNTDWMGFTVERDRDYCALILEREAEFWSHVQKDLPPPRNDPIPSLPSLELMRPLDMRLNNKWNDGEATWIEELPHAQRFDAAVKNLKELVPADVDFAFGQELVCVRDRAGKLSLRYPNKKDSQRMADELESAAIREELEL
jgi:predicted phage-related endonuclease